MFSFFFGGGATTHTAGTLSSPSWTGTHDVVCDYGAVGFFTFTVGHNGNFHLLQFSWIRKRSWKNKNKNKMFMLHLMEFFSPHLPELSVGSHSLPTLSKYSAALLC